MAISSDVVRVRHLLYYFAEVKSILFGRLVSNLLMFTANCAVSGNFKLCGVSFMLEEE